MACDSRFRVSRISECRVCGQLAIRVELGEIYLLKNRAQRTRFGPAGWASSSPARAVPARPVRSTVTDVLLESLWLLKDRDARIDALRADIEEGFVAVERGEYTDYDVCEVGKLADKIKAEGMQRALDRRALKPIDRQMIDFK